MAITQGSKPVNLILIERCLWVAVADCLIMGLNIFKRIRKNCGSILIYYFYLIPAYLMGLFIFAT